jgi:NTP pyrophosphatase (non-canonical NTP hydrolase)
MQKDKLEVLFDMQRELNVGYFNKLGLGTYPEDLWNDFNNISEDAETPILFAGIQFSSYQAIKEFMARKTSQPAKWVREYTRALVHEALEVDDAAKFKFWDTDTHVDFDEVAREIVDVWHFLISMTQVAGISVDQLFEMYTKKHAINEKRRDSGSYSTTEKASKPADDAHIKIKK